MSDRELACRDAVELFSDYLEGALTPELTALCEAHLRECSACMRYLAQLRVSVEALSRMPDALDPECRATLLALFRKAHGGNDTGGAEG